MSTGIVRLDEGFIDRETGHTHVDGKALIFIDHYSASPGMVSSRVSVGSKFGDTIATAKASICAAAYFTGPAQGSV